MEDTTARHFEHSYAELGSRYSSEQLPTPVSAPQWIHWNAGLAETLDWPAPWSQTDLALNALAGNALLPSSKPIATVYAGHQFGSYNPRLGDGRALLLGEWQTEQGERFDIQLKGAGPTPYSRGGDGRSPVGPVVREYLVSEGMHALGVKTSRALCAIATGDPVYRQHPEPGAVLTRVAASHLRIGTVQYFAMSQRGEGLAELVDYVAQRHYPEALTTARQLAAGDLTPEQLPGLAGLALAPPESADATLKHHLTSFYGRLAECEQPEAGVLLQEVCAGLADLAASWQSLGFIHGVLNTDNMLLCAQTIDYGPCAFMDHYHPNKVFSSIDTGGRYAFGNQPGIVHWNLSVLAQCLLPLLHKDEDTALALAQGIVDAFPGYFHRAFAQRLAKKFGVGEVDSQRQQDIQQFYDLLAEHQVDLTLAMRWLSEWLNDRVDATPLPDLFTPPEPLQLWAQYWRRQTDDTPDVLHHRQAMLHTNPVVIPRNHHIADAIKQAEQQDYHRVATLFERYQTPYVWLDNDEDFARAPAPEQVVTRTFCGT